MKRVLPPLVSLLVVSLLGVLIGWLVKILFYSKGSEEIFTIESLRLTPAQLELLAEVGLDEARLKTVLSTLSASKLFFSASLDKLVESFEDLLSKNGQAAARLYQLAMSHADLYTLASRIAALSFPQQVMRIKRALQSSGKAFFNQKATLNPAEAVKEWKRFLSTSEEGKAIMEWLKKMKDDYKYLLNATSMALPQKVVEWCEGIIRNNMQEL